MTDPTKETKFQQVVRHFLSTPPKPHKPPQKRKAPTKSAARKRRLKPQV